MSLRELATGTPITEDAQVEAGKQYLSEVQFSSPWNQPNTQRMVDDAIHAWLDQRNQDMQPWQVLMVDDWELYQVSEGSPTKDAEWALYILWHVEVSEVPPPSAVPAIGWIIAALTAIIATSIGTIISISTYTVARTIITNAEPFTNAVVIAVVGGVVSYMVPKQYRIFTVLGAGVLAYLAWRKVL